MHRKVCAEVNGTILEGRGKSHRYWSAHMLKTLCGTSDYYHADTKTKGICSKENGMSDQILYNFQSPFYGVQEFFRF